MPNVITGTDAADTLIGTPDDDIVTGGRGNDTAFMGDGNDVFVWNPGDGSDIVEGQSGFDTLQFNGANIGENFSISANGSRAQLFRNVGNVTMDINDVERIQLTALGGPDNIVVNDLTGTDVTEVAIDLAATPGTGIGDAQADTVTLNGSAAGDAIALIGGGGSILVTGLPATVTITGAEPANDALFINGFDGNDTIDASMLSAAQINLTIDGGAGNDSILGSRGADTLSGGTGDDTVIGGMGNDVAFLGDGNDTFIWNPGDGSDTVQGQAGIDTLEFNGSGANENIGIGTNGTDVFLSRDVGAVTMDLNGVENIVINAGAGDDTIAAQNGLATLTQLTIDGGAGNDSITGGDGADTLLGGDGDDTIVGGRGNDTAFMGDGNDVFVWNPGDGSDIVEGQSGFDTLQFVGANIGENFSISANGSRAQLFRNVGNVTMDINDVERIQLTALGGPDNIVVNDLTGTDVTQVAIDLAATPGTGIGDAQADTVTLNGSAAGDAIALIGGAGSILVTGLPATVTITGAEPANDALFINGFDGNDTIDASMLSAAQINLTIDGGAGNDSILGSRGADTLSGGTGDDTVIGGMGNDVAFLGDGNDTFIWNPGDGSDTVQGQAGIDTLEFNGSGANENIGIGTNGTDVFLSRDVGAVTMDLNGVENIVINAGAGDDTIAAQNGLATLTQLTIDGGAGNDSITGGDGADTLLGGDGDDTIVGGRGNDTAFMGDGNDVFVWNPGDGSDIVEGQSGFDTLQFVGANIGENFSISANGSRAQLFRNVGNVTMDINDVERIQLTALGGPDNIVVNDLTGTDVTQVAIDLAATPGTGIGDAQADTVTLNGSAAGDAIALIGGAGSILVTGLPATVTITGAEPANDALFINGFDGNDTIDASMLSAAQINLTIDGGAGNDSILGSRGADTLSGGTGDDTVIGGMGNDVAFLGDGNDTFIWNPGDGSDIVEGQGGFDTLFFAGSNASENIDVSANGDRVRLFRDVGSVTMDMNDVEKLHITAIGGADRITVNSLAGTDLQQVDIDLAGVAGGGDGQADTVVLNANAAADVIMLARSGTSFTVAGLPGVVTVANFESTLDSLVINALAGDDTVIAKSGALSAGEQIDGGAGTNTLALQGPGSFDLRAPAVLANIQLVTAQEGQAGFSAGGTVFAAQNQIVQLRDGLDATVNVLPATLNPANPKPATITIVGAHNAAVINLGAGNDTVIVGDARETIHGGSGDNTIQVTSATIGATIDGGTGNSSLMVGGGGAVVMGANVTHIPNVFLTPATAIYDFTANAIAGLTVTDLGKGADTLRAGGVGQTLTGGAGNVHMVGFAGGGTTFLNTAAAFNGDTIAGLVTSDAIDVSDLNFASLTKSFVENNSHTAGALGLSDGIHATSLTIAGDHQLSDFQFAAFGANGTAVVLHS